MTQPVPAIARLSEEFSQRGGHCQVEEERLIIGPKGTRQCLGVGVQLTAGQYPAEGFSAITLVSMAL
jgi:hypothetical protein